MGFLIAIEMLENLFWRCEGVEDLVVGLRRFVRGLGLFDLGVFCLGYCLWDLILDFWERRQRGRVISDDANHECCVYLELNHTSMTIFVSNLRTLIACLSATHVDYFEGKYGVLLFGHVAKAKGAGGCSRERRYCQCLIACLERKL